MKEIPYSVICAAQRGDTEAILMIRRHFEGYIASKCLVTYDDGDGQSYTFPDDELRYLAEAALYTHYVVIGCCNDQGKTVSEKVKNLIRLEARNVAADCEEI